MVQKKPVLNLPKFTIFSSICKWPVRKYDVLKTFIPSVKIPFCPEVFSKSHMYGRGTHSLSIISVSDTSGNFMFILSLNICTLNYDILLRVCVCVCPCSLQNKNTSITCLLYETETFGSLI